MRLILFKIVQRAEYYLSPIHSHHLIKVSINSEKIRENGLRIAILYVAIKMVFQIKLPYRPKIYDINYLNHI